MSNLKIDNNVLRRYADLDYEVWYALSEFVDNSLHSFLNSKNELEKIGIHNCSVKMSIIEEDGKEVISINDNAGGIHENDFERLLSIGIQKERSEVQLSEFGMGMKTAAIWLGKIIEIETKHYLSDKSFLITININKLGTDDEVTIKEVVNSSNLKGYTKIKIKDLNRSFTKKNTLEKIQRSLASIYKKFIEKSILKIVFTDLELEPEFIKLETHPDGSDIRKDFLITLSNGKSARGWIGIMGEGRKSVYSGFSIYRHDRLIQGYPVNTWRPKEVFGQEGGSNTLKNQRLIGEIDMTSFQVAHTKNKINFIDDEEDEFRDKLGKSCSDIATEATNKRVNTPKEELNDPDTKIARDKIIDVLNKPSNFSIEQISFIEPTIKENSKSLVDKLTKENDPFIKQKFYEGEDLEVTIIVYLFDDRSLPYLVQEEVDDIIYVCVNYAHPFYQLKVHSADDKSSFVLNCIFDALAENNVQKRYGSHKPEDFRITKDLFLKRYAKQYNDEN
jgi:hypothetical protein